MDYYKIRLSPKGWALYRVNQGKVEKWQPLSKKWKTSALYKGEGELMRAGAIHESEQRMKAFESGLKLFNGRGQTRRHTHGGGECRHVYICAESKADAVRVMQEAGFHFRIGELNEYFSKDCWGTRMEGIEPQRGVWVTWTEHGPAERVI